MSWISSPKNPFRGAAFGPPGSARRACKKCESTSTGVHYDGSVDLMRYRCHDCGYEWTGMPADAKARSSLSAGAEPK